MIGSAPRRLTADDVRALGEAIAADRRAAPPSLLRRALRRVTETIGCLELVEVGFSERKTT